MELLTAAQMRNIEQAAINNGEVTGLELMERAGQGVVDAIFEEWPEYKTAPQSVSVLCGPGNNGGDGYVVARLLKRLGWQVYVFALGETAKLPADARTNFEIWNAEHDVSPLTERSVRSANTTLYIDALFGTGLTRPLTHEASNIMRHFSGANGDDYSDSLICIDAPSGLCLDSGRVLNPVPTTMHEQMLSKAGRQPVIRPPFEHSLAALTVTFDSPKVGHFLTHGPHVCGKLVVKDIGLEKWRVFQKNDQDKPAFIDRNGFAIGTIRPPKIQLITREPLINDQRSQFLAFDIRNLSRRGTGHKFRHGHALILSGSSGSTGAARLAGRGAARIGAGLVTLGVTTEAQIEVASQITSIMTKQIDTAAELSTALLDKRFNALCLGPGLGIDRAKELVPTALETKKACVLDADSLTAFTDNPDALFANLHEKVVLTPHGGEFSRLFPDIADKLAAPANKGPAYSKADATRDAAERAKCFVLFKGPNTVIAAPDGQTRIHSATDTRAVPWLATAGAGDVLAGFITGLLARGLFHMRAIEIATWLHVECARSFGPGLIAEDLPEELPKVFRQLGVT